MDSLGLAAAFRTDVDDNVAPYLWSDALVALYANEAQNMFCRLTNGIADTSSQLCSVDISAGEPFSPIDKRILKLRRVSRDSDGRVVEITSIEQMDADGIRLTSQAGPVDAVILGLEDHTVRWVKVPAVDDSATLSVYRLPLRTITVAKTILGIDEQHHFSLLLWMKHLAYSKQDTDTMNVRAAQSNEAAFRAYCAQVKAEQDRAAQKIRVVRYGGIGGASGGGHGHRGYGRGSW